MTMMNSVPPTQVSNEQIGSSLVDSEDDQINLTPQTHTLIDKLPDRPPKTPKTSGDQAVTQIKQDDHREEAKTAVPNSKAFDF